MKNKALEINMNKNSAQYQPMCWHLCPRISPLLAKINSCPVCCLVVQLVLSYLFKVNPSAFIYSPDHKFLLFNYILYNKKTSISPIQKFYNTE